MCLHLASNPETFIARCPPGSDRFETANPFFFFARRERECVSVSIDSGSRRKGKGGCSNDDKREREQASVCDKNSQHGEATNVARATDDESVDLARSQEREIPDKRSSVLDPFGEWHRIEFRLRVPVSDSTASRPR